MSFYKKSKDRYSFPMIKWAKDLFPICRSLMGDGTRKTFKYFKKLNPEFEKVEFKTGKKVFDWEIPKEWSIKDAYIKHESGKKFADFKKTNLHVVGYSKPINKILSKKDLINKVSTLNVLENCLLYLSNSILPLSGNVLSSLNFDAILTASPPLECPITIILLKSILLYKIEEESLFNSLR